jgi:hypothetical protein
MPTVVPEPDKRPLENLPAPPATDRPAISDENDESLVIHVGLLAYLRTMWALHWTAFRYPLTTTYIDAGTGEVLFDDAGENR